MPAFQRNLLVSWALSSRWKVGDIVEGSGGRSRVMVRRVCLRFDVGLNCRGGYSLAKPVRLFEIVKAPSDRAQDFACRRRLLARRTVKHPNNPALDLIPGVRPQRSVVPGTWDQHKALRAP